MNSRFVDSNLFLLEIQNKLYLFIYYIDNIHYFYHFFYFCEPSHIYIQLKIIIHVSYNFLYIYRKSKCKIETEIKKTTRFDSGGLSFCSIGFSGHMRGGLSLLFLNTRFGMIGRFGFAAVLTTVALSMGEGK